MHKPLVIIGLGEMGGVFARGFLRLGYPVYPVTRQMTLSSLYERLSDAELILVAVGEKDLQDVLLQIPQDWRDKVVLLQNELLPNDWQQFDNPTVISVWFEKKPGKAVKVIIPSVIYGPHANLASHTLESIQIPTRMLKTSEELLFELVLKNLYILTTNIAGLRTGGTVGELWEHHRQFAVGVAAEVIEIQQALTERTFDSEALLAALVTAFQGDPDHQCKGRSAQERLKRTLTHADRFGLATPLMRELQTQQDAF